MLIFNFYNIKATNGLFYYGLDCLVENMDLVRSILVRPGMDGEISKVCPNANVIICSKLRYFYELICARLKSDYIYTPTSHPLPLLNNQWIVLHDPYPFESGKFAKLKYLLFKYSLMTSRCRVAYINCSEAKPFLERVGVSPDRMVFAPNKFPEKNDRLLPIMINCGKTVVGLFGTDSNKKNYNLIFDAVRCANLNSILLFRIFGHDTEYFDLIKKNYPDIDIELVKSDMRTIDEFLLEVDVLASASTREGFGRPFASALLAGMRVELLDRPVFREFYTDGARFHDDIYSLVKALHLGCTIYKPNHKYVAPVVVVNAYFNAKAQLRQLATCMEDEAINAK